MILTEIFNKLRIIRSPLVSVIIPAYNKSDYIGEAIESILSQSYRNLECYIIDDGSTDKTALVAEKYLKVDNRLHLLKQSNRGLSNARNVGLSKAKGDYIQFLDADDWITSDKLKNQVQAALTNKADIVYSDYLCVSGVNLSDTWTYSRVELKEVPFEDFLTEWEKELSIPIHCMLFKSNLFSNGILFDEQLESHEDWDLHLQISLKKAYYFYLPGQNSYYRILQNSMCRDEEKMHKGRQSVIRNWLRSAEISLEQKMVLMQRFIDNNASYFSRS